MHQPETQAKPFRYGQLVMATFAGLSFLATVRDFNANKTVTVFDGSRKFNVKPDACQKVVPAC
jgi:hypothetical protein